MFHEKNPAIIIPMANEEKDFLPFTRLLDKVVQELGIRHVYFIVDSASNDNTLQLCRDLSAAGSRYVTIWAPENQNVVDAYLKGMKTAYSAGHDQIIEMDAGLSHDPAEIKNFLNALEQGYECVFGSRFIQGGTMGDSPLRRKILSRTGTVLSNLLLGTQLKDMTSGYQAFSREVAGRIIQYPFRSTAHFYHTELRYLLRKSKFIEIPIQYRSPSPRVSGTAISNSIRTLLYYFILRIKGKRPTL